VLLSVQQTCKYRGVSFLKFLLSQEEDVETYCQRGRKKKRPIRLEVYPKGFPRMYPNRSYVRKRGNNGGTAARVRWKSAILAFLRGRPERWASRSDIAEHCVGLIRGGVLITAAPVNDRPRLDRIVSMYLSALKRAGEVARRPDKAYFVTARGLAWLERHPNATVDCLPAGEAAPGGEPEAAGRTIAIGDIHGCATALRALLAAVAPRRQDTVVTLGDCIDCGPDSKGVVRVLLGLLGRCTLVPLKGDHEERFLEALGCRDDLRCWLGLGGEQTLRSYGITHPRRVPRSHCSFLNSFKDHHETETHLFVHASYQANLPLHGQPPAVLLRRSLDADWPGPHASGKVAVVGHTPQKGGDILDLGHLVCIDTDCRGGGWLTALDVGSGHYWQANERGEVRQGRLVSAVGAAAEPGQGAEASATT
jgi:serine/threonine protein phosphatase 1